MPQAARVHRARAHKRGDGRKPRNRKTYDSRLWRDRIRPHQLSVEPLCRECKHNGKVTLAKHVDHIDGDNTNNADENLQSLCASCHSRKTVVEDGGFGRRPGVA